uniref:Uncharacterized protein n=1 Tax=Rhizophora mucronata TaxID=61149 RepID=A0A2P2QUD2_RHIMU
MSLKFRRLTKHDL